MGLKPFCHCTACSVSPEGRLGLVTVLTDHGNGFHNYFALAPPIQVLFWGVVVILPALLDTA